MNIDSVIEQIVEEIKNLTNNTVDKTAEVAALNVANSILYPLKENKQIEDYQFSANIIGNTLNIGIIVTENGQTEPSQWDLSIRP
jgi:hypothetical protein